MNLATPSTIASWLHNARSTLAGHTDSATIDAELLLMHAMQLSRTELLIHPDRIINAEHVAALDELLGRRVAGEPIAYILGQKEFWSLDLIVTPATLIPRPDTELLVEWGLEQLNGRTNAQVLDLGTGSGNIVLALATQNPGHRYLATDISEDCLAVARHNAQRHNMSQVEFRAGSWFAPLSSTDEFDVIVSNPPYIAKNDPWLKQGDVQKEPDRALVSSAQGLADISHIIGQAGRWLKDTGCIGLEHGYNQAEEVRRLFAQHGYTDIQTRCDLAGHERITTAKKGSLTGLN